MGFLRRIFGNDGTAVPDRAPFDAAKDHVNTSTSRRGPSSWPTSCPLSDQPYRWREDTIVQIPHREDGTKIAVHPPDELAVALEQVLARSAAE